MTLAGWLTMIMSISGVLALTAWCFIKVFRSGDKRESAIELITPDMEEYESGDE